MSEEIQEEKAQDYNKRILFVLLFFVIVIALFYVAKTYYEPKPQELERMEYNKFEFVKYQGLWYTEWQRGENIYQIPLRFNPKEVEDVIIVGQLDKDFALEKEVYITFDPEQENLTNIALGAAELSQNMARALAIKPIAACTVNETDACFDRPIKTCPEKNESIIYLHHAAEPRIILKDTCVILEGPNLQLLKAIDRLLYQWYGIME